MFSVPVRVRAAQSRPRNRNAFSSLVAVERPPSTRAAGAIRAVALLESLFSSLEAMTAEDFGDYGLQLPG